MPAKQIGDDEIKRPKTRGLPSEMSAPSAPERKSDRHRQRLIDATLECFVEDGWARTNMSMIARRAGVTRGMMQYYFPTLQDALEASVNYLNETWRLRYFEAINSRRRISPDSYFEFGIDHLWKRLREPLHVAKQELEAAARTDPDLRAVMEASARADEAVALEAAALVYHELAAVDSDAFRVTRDFTLVFLEGLTLYRFATDAEPRRERLVAMLKQFLADYWRAHGAGDRLMPQPVATAGDHDGLDRADAVLEAMALLSRAQALLQGARTEEQAPTPVRTTSRRRKPKD